MELNEQPQADATAPAGWSGRAPWLLCLFALVGVQAWLTLNLFGPNHPWWHLLDDQPILSGQHPLHLDHGSLGARSLWQRGTLCCYDPGFQAGYPKTPVFDGGSRPAELFLLLVGARYSPGAYKLGLALCCCALPLAFVLAAWGLGMRRLPALIAAVLGTAVFWGAPGRALVEAGDLDLVLASLAALVQVGLLVRFDRTPGLLVWLGLLASGCLGWFTQPVLFFTLLLVLVLTYYISAGVRHALGWHLALLAGLVGGVALNAFWLPDWINYWWLLAPLPLNPRLLTHRTLPTLWASPFWGDGSDRTLALVLVLSGVAGLAIFNQCKGRIAARLLGLAFGGLLVLALVGLATAGVGRFGTAKLLVPALWFAVLPAVHAWCWIGERGLRWAGRGGMIVVATALLLGVAWLSYPALRDGAAPGGGAPLLIGLGSERQTLVEVLTKHTNAEARILWEDRPDCRAPSRWTTLLPLLTGRAYLGGLDTGAVVEHAQPSLSGQLLAGRALATWSDQELDEFCRRYNVGWVVCWSATTEARFRAWVPDRATVVSELQEDGRRGWLFALNRPRSFVLKGQANWQFADCRRITLTDVVPEDGQVVLSLHYQEGLAAMPSFVRIERDPDREALDPTPFIRLRVPGPVTRITLTWEDP